MRVVFAGLFVFVVIIAAVVSLSALFEDGTAGWLIGFVISAVGGLAIAGAHFLFNAPEDHWPRLSIEAMEARGLVTSSQFRARRAFGVREYEDEAPRYFIELEDEGVLYLCGEYLYDYEPFDEPDFEQTRQFPCSLFAVKRGIRDGYVLAIVTEGAVLEPDSITLLPNDHENIWPTDGAMLRDAPYDALKRRVIGGAG